MEKADCEGICALASLPVLGHLAALVLVAMARKRAVSQAGASSGSSNKKSGRTRIWRRTLQEQKIG